MRILLVTSTDQESGGVASVIANLARYLQSRAHEIIFLYAGDSISPKKINTKLGFTGFEINLRLPFREGRHPIITLAAFLICFPISMYQLIRFIQKHKIQIINIHYPHEFFFYFALCSRIVPRRPSDGEVFARYPASASFIGSHCRTLTELSERRVWNLPPPQRKDNVYS